MDNLNSLAREWCETNLTMDSYLDSANDATGIELQQELMRKYNHYRTCKRILEAKMVKAYQEQGVPQKTYTLSDLTSPEVLEKLTEVIKRGIEEVFISEED